MDNQTTTAAKLAAWDIALPDSGAGQGTVVETFIRKDKALQGNLYLVGQIYSSRERRENAQLLSRIVETLETYLTPNSTTSAESVFEQALARTNRLIREERAHEFRNYTLKINMAVVLRVDSTLYVSRIGHGVVLRERNKKLSHITKRPLYSPDPNHHLIFQEIVTVSLQNDDRIYVGTPQIYKVGEALLTSHPTTRDLHRAVSAHADDLRNLGLIMLHNKPRRQHRASGSGEARPAAIPNKKTAHMYERMRTALAGKKPFLFAGAILIVSALLLWALFAQKDAVSQQQHRDALLQEITLLEEKTTALVELENYEEAAQLVQQIYTKIEQLEQEHGVTEESRRLRSEARYLSSLLPIRQ